MGLPWLPVVVVEEVAVGKLGRPESIGLTSFSDRFTGLIPDFLDFGPGKHWFNNVFRAQNPECYYIILYYIILYHIILYNII